MASFLADPYVERSAREQERLLAVYNETARRPVSAAAYRAALAQRLAQALGAYGRLGANQGTRRFLQYIAPAVRQLAAGAEDPVIQQWAGNFLNDKAG